MTTKSGTTYHASKSQPALAMDPNIVDALITRIDQTITLYIKQVNQKDGVHEKDYQINA